MLLCLLVHVDGTWAPVPSSGKKTASGHTWKGFPEGLKRNFAPWAVFGAGISQLRERGGSWPCQQGTSRKLEWPGWPGPSQTDQPSGLRVVGTGLELLARPPRAGAPPRGPRSGLQRPQRAPFQAACFLARGHAGHWLRAHSHVHAPPQHRDQTAAIHQVSGRRGRAGGLSPGETPPPPLPWP